MGETAITVESISSEYLRLFDEGWNPNIDEFLSRVPEEMRGDCRQRIEELAALNGLDLSQSGGPPAPAAAAPQPEAEAAPDLGTLAQEITPDGTDASGSSPRLRRTNSVMDEMSAVNAQEKRKPRKKSKRGQEPETAAAAPEVQEQAAVPEIQAEPELPAPEQVEAPPEHTETQLLETPPTRASRSRDEPTYTMPTTRPAAAPPPVRPKPPPAARPSKAAAVPAVSEETRNEVLARLRDVNHLERLGAVPGVESDRLHVIYRRILDTQGAAGDLPITLPHLALYAFVAAAVAGAALFVALVHDAAPALQALVPGAIFLTLVGAGVRARSQADGAGTALFFAAAAIAAAPAIIAGLAVGGMLAGDGALPAPLSDLRLLAGTGGALAFAAFCLVLLRRGLFAWATAALAAAAFGSMVLVLGTQELAAHEIALRFLPLVLLAVPGLLLENQGKVRWAMPFHLVALGALVVPLDVMALQGKLLELLGLGAVCGAARLPYLGFAAAGLLLAILSLAFERARSFDLRRGARFLQLLAAIHLVVALGWSAAVNGAGRDVVALGGASTLLMVLGRYHRQPLLIAGGLGFVLALSLVAVGGLMAPGSFALALSGAGLLGALGIYFYLGRRSST